VHYNATRKLVLTGADGIVMVFDSQRAREDANLETLENLKDNLNAHGKSLPEVPHVVQFNKRDLYDVTPIEELERSLNRLVCAFVCHGRYRRRRCSTKPRGHHARGDGRFSIGGCRSHGSRTRFLEVPKAALSKRWRRANTARPSRSSNIA